MGAGVIGSHYRRLMSTACLSSRTGDRPPLQAAMQKQTRQGTSSSGLDVNTETFASILCAGEREAELALSQIRGGCSSSGKPTQELQTNSNPSCCVSCGLVFTPDSLFCRRCG